MSTLTIRTQDEILERIRHLNRSPIGLGFHQEVLVLYGLDYDHAAPFLKADVTRGAWGSPSTKSVKDKAVQYLEFAIGKALDHRGLSAARSIEKMECFCWLLGGREGIVTDEPFPMYGLPGLRAAAGFLGVSWPTGDSKLDNMTAGRVCEPGCMDGCEM